MGYFNKNKMEETILSAFKQSLTFYFKQKILHTDNGREFRNKVLEIYFKENNIDHITWGSYNHNIKESLKRLIKLFKIFWYQLRIIKGSFFELILLMIS